MSRRAAERLASLDDSLRPRVAELRSYVRLSLKSAAALCLSEEDLEAQAALSEEILAEVIEEERKEALVREVLRS